MNNSDLVSSVFDRTTKLMDLVDHHGLYDTSHLRPQLLVGQSLFDEAFIIQCIAKEFHTIKQLLCAYYKIDQKAFLKWVKKIKHQKISLKDVQNIYNKLGTPGDNPSLVYTISKLVLEKKDNAPDEVFAAFYSLVKALARCYNVWCS